MKPDLQTLIQEVKTFTQAEFDAFARLSGDDNPIHVDPEFSARTRFGRTVAHGMLLYSVICGAISRHFPGAVQISQELKFPAPTFAEEPMTILLQLAETDGKQARLLAEMHNPAGAVTVTGEAVILL
jgi:3-hydroxybutyryl-CoA dehydratase